MTATTDAFAARPAAATARPLFGGLIAFARSFAWALEVRRRCDRAAASGRRLDGTMIRRIAADVDAALAPRD